MLGHLVTALRAPWRRAAAASEGAGGAADEPGSGVLSQQQPHDLRHRRSEQRPSDPQPDAGAGGGEGERTHAARQTKRGAAAADAAAAATPNKQQRTMKEGLQQQQVPNGGARQKRGRSSSGSTANGFAHPSAPAAPAAAAPAPAPKRPRGRPRKVKPAPLAPEEPAPAAARPGSQPAASLNEDHAEMRPSAPLAAALACPVCRDVLKEPVTALECGHTMCYDCLDAAIVVGGKHNMCPVCGDLLGPSPFDHAKVRFDPALDSLVKKVFPRPLLDAALDARRAEREEGTREFREELMQRRGYLRKGPAIGSAPVKEEEAEKAGGGGQGGGGGSGDEQGTVAVVLVPETAAAAAAGTEGKGPAETGTPVRALRNAASAAAAAAAAAEALPPVELPPLSRPFVSAPPGMTVGTLRAWLIEELGSPRRGSREGAGGGSGGGAGSGGQQEEQQQQANGQAGQQQQQQQQQKQLGKRRRGKGQRQKQQQQTAQDQSSSHQQQQQAGGQQGAVVPLSKSHLDRIQLVCRGQALTNMSEPIARLQQRVRAAKASRRGGSVGGAAAEAEAGEAALTLTYRVA